MTTEEKRPIYDKGFLEESQMSTAKSSEEDNQFSRSNEVHLIFFHGIGDNHERATMDCEATQKNFSQSTKAKFYAHAYKYPIAFQYYLIFFVASLLFLIASVLAPVTMILCNPSIMMVGLAILAALSCIALSISLLVIPFFNKDQNLFKSSIDKIDQLIDEGVKPENIILVGHSFRGVAESAVLKHFADEGVTLGGAFFNSAFSSFEVAIKNFPLPQTKILSMLPPSLFKKLLKALDLDFDVAKDIIKLQNEGLGTQIVVANNKDDELIPQAAQLIHSINHCPSSIITIDEKGDHNHFSEALLNKSNTLINGKIDYINCTMSK
ncbi:MAG: hypothetical protein PG981_000440 [Wolbachia endosymbiont of Ctenocephalides orientis wCori]|nr:MAG: hypothetical protein PG981_000440 [Wolbachia endosymbiont of Ctenocephalides orientis wCori]